MKVKLEKNSIIIDVSDLIEELTQANNKDLLESLSTNSYVIQFVTEQILDKWTGDNCCSGSYSVAAPSSPTFGLDWAWREVAKRSNEVAAREIIRLEQELKRKEEENIKLRSESSFWQNCRTD